MFKKILIWPEYVLVELSSSKINCANMFVNLVYCGEIVDPNTSVSSCNLAID
jgi:hypothetical protein